MEKNYLCLYPDTFLWKKYSKGLIYNSKHGRGFCFNSCAVEEKIKELSNIENLYCVELDSFNLIKPEFKQFIFNIEKSKAGELLQMAADNPKPVVLPPLLNLQSEIGRLQKKVPEIVGENILEYLHELTLWIGVESKDNIDFNLLEKYLNFASYSSLAHVRIKGNEIFAFPKLMKLIDTLDRIHIRKSIHLKIEDWNEGIHLNHIFSSPQFVIVIEVDIFKMSDKMNKIVSTTKIHNINTEWEFQIRNKKEYQVAEILIEKYQLQHTEIKPKYTGKNIQFFKDNIYLTEEDIQNQSLSRREVFAHQALNTNDFGKLTIMPDGKVYANPHFPALGTIEDDIRELVYKEMVNGTSWRRIRDMKPCCDCVYQWLCPSPSDYELAIGKPNLCHIKP